MKCQLSIFIHLVSPIFVPAHPLTFHLSRAARLFLVELPHAPLPLAVLNQPQLNSSTKVWKEFLFLNQIVILCGLSALCAHSSHSKKKSVYIDSANSIHCHWCVRHTVSTRLHSTPTISASVLLLVSTLTGIDCSWANRSTLSAIRWVRYIIVCRQALSRLRFQSLLKNVFKPKIKNILFRWHRKFLNFSSIAFQWSTISDEGQRRDNLRNRIVATLRFNWSVRWSYNISCSHLYSFLAVFLAEETHPCLWLFLTSQWLISSQFLKGSKVWIPN